MIVVIKRIDNIKPGTHCFSMTSVDIKMSQRAKYHSLNISWDGCWLFKHCTLGDTVAVVRGL